MPKAPLVRKGKHPGGRPTKLTPEVQTTIVNALAAGVYLETAASAAGINRATLNRWLKEGNRHQNGIRSGNIRVAGEVIKGYQRGQFEDSWSRYPPSKTPERSATSATLAPVALSRRSGWVFCGVALGVFVADAIRLVADTASGGVADVAAKTGGDGGVELPKQAENRGSWGAV